MRLTTEQWRVMLEALRRYAAATRAAYRRDEAQVAHAALSRLVVYRLRASVDALDPMDRVMLAHELAQLAASERRGVVMTGTRRSGAIWGVGPSRLADDKGRRRTWRRSRPGRPAWTLIDEEIARLMAAPPEPPDPPERAPLPPKPPRRAHRPRKPQPSDLLARVRREITDRRRTLAPVVDEAARLEAALTALNKSPRGRQS